MKESFPHILIYANSDYIQLFHRNSVLIFAMAFFPRNTGAVKAHDYNFGFIGSIKNGEKLTLENTFIKTEKKRISLKLIVHEGLQNGPGVDYRKQNQPF